LQTLRDLGPTRRQEGSVGRPLEGTIVAYSLTDGVGRIRLDDGEELRFSVRAMQNIVPAVGLRVVIGATEPYPLGGRRALAITLGADRSTYEQLRAEYDRAQGEVMRRELGRRAAEFELPPSAIQPALSPGPRRATTARPSSKRATTARPSSKRATTARSSSKRATTARPSSKRATTARPSSKRAATAQGGRKPARRRGQSPS
jgi:hypothetical protein